MKKLSLLERRTLQMGRVFVEDVDSDVRLP
jgi:hypothetical protein